MLITIDPCQIQDMIITVADGDYKIGIGKFATESLTVEVIPS